MKTDAATHTITLDVHSVERLLDADGSPLLCPRIHPDAARSIFHDAEGRRPNGGFQVAIRVPPHDLPRGSEVETAIHAHFAAETEDPGYELRETLWRGGYSLLLALLAVASLVMFAEWLQVLGQGRLYKYLGESLIIIGWVTLWTPIELLMFDHFPIRRRRSLARVLARSRVVLETR
jgi:hypothetical protein